MKWTHFSGVITRANLKPDVKFSPFLDFTPYAYATSKYRPIWFVSGSLVPVSAIAKTYHCALAGKSSDSRVSLTWVTRAAHWRNWPSCCDLTPWTHLNGRYVPCLIRIVNGYLVIASPRKGRLEGAKLFPGAFSGMTLHATSMICCNVLSFRTAITSDLIE